MKYECIDKDLSGMLFAPKEMDKGLKLSDYISSPMMLMASVGYSSSPEGFGLLTPENIAYGGLGMVGLGMLTHSFIRMNNEEPEAKCPGGILAEAVGGIGILLADMVIYSLRH